MIYKLKRKDEQVNFDDSYMLSGQKSHFFLCISVLVFTNETTFTKETFFLRLIH